jgi:RNA polymerase sigma factor (TIGR02999 family)
MCEVTRILHAIEEGSTDATDKLLAIVYDELRRLAAQKMSRESPGQTLQATALVHEAYLRLVGPDGDVVFHGRGHFFGAAAEAMRRILVDQALRKKRPKHGGDRQRVDLDSYLSSGDSTDDEILALNEALTKLTHTDETSAEVVKLKYFAGLTIPQIAENLGVSVRTADRRWAYARAWLHQALHAEK